MFVQLSLSRSLCLFFFYPLYHSLSHSLSPSFHLLSVCLYNVHSSLPLLSISIAIYLFLSFFLLSSPPLLLFLFYYGFLSFFLSFFRSIYCDLSYGSRNNSHIILSLSFDRLCVCV